MATYDGFNVFGRSVAIAHALNPPAEQINAFFGVSGTQSLFGGLRGRVFLISGVFAGVDVSALNAAESLFLSYCDGIARTLVDTRGRTWFYVKLKPPQVADRVLSDGRGLYLNYRSAAQGLV